MAISRKYQGIIAITISALGFAGMNFFVRLSEDLPSMQKVLFRNAVSLVVSFIMLMRDGDTYRGMDGKSWLLLFLRSLFGGVSIFAFFYAIDHMVISDATMLNNMSSFFTLTFSFIFLKEKISWKQAVLILGAFLGSLFIVKPQGIGTEDFFPALMGLLSGIGTGVAMTSLRALGKRGVKGPKIIFAFSLFSLLITLPFAIPVFEPMTFEQVLCLLLAGACATVGQFGVTIGYRLAPGREISIYEYTNVIFSALLGFVFLGQIPDRYSIMGYIIIFAMAFLMFLYTKRHGDQQG